MMLKRFRLPGLVVGLALALGLAAAATPAIAAGSSDDGASTAADPDYNAAKTAVKAGKYDEAIALLDKVVAKNPNDANALNYLGYSHRQLKRYDQALAFYQKALAIQPDHRGALEYLGELYLQTGKLSQAEAQLSKLDKACFFGCAEYNDLKDAIAAYKQNNPQG